MNHSEFFKGDDDEQEALELISTIGCSMSFIGIFLTMLTYALLWKRLNPKSKVPSIVLMHLCVAIGMTDIFAIMAGPARNNGVSPWQTKNAAKISYFLIVGEIMIWKIHKVYLTF